jgi:hypothetical protein
VTVKPHQVVTHSGKVIQVQQYQAHRKEKIEEEKKEEREEPKGNRYSPGGRRLHQSLNLGQLSNSRRRLNPRLERRYHGKTDNGERKTETNGDAGSCTSESRQMSNGVTGDWTVSDSQTLARGTEMTPEEQLSPEEQQYVEYLDRELKEKNELGEHFRKHGLEIKTRSFGKPLPKLNPDGSYADPSLYKDEDEGGDEGDDEGDDEGGGGDEGGEPEGEPGEGEPTEGEPEETLG